MKRKKLNPILITVLIIAFLMVDWGITSVIQKATITEFTSQDQVVQFTRKTLSCEAYGSETSKIYSIPKDGAEVKCSETFGVTTPGCTIFLKVNKDSGGFAFDNYVQVKICNINDRNNCRRNEKITTKNIVERESILNFPISNNEFISLKYFDYSLFGDDILLDGLTVRSLYQPYDLILKGTFTGEEPLRNGNCNAVPQSLRSKYVKSSTDKESFDFDGIDNLNLQPGDRQSTWEAPVLIPKSSYSLQKIENEYRLCQIKQLFELELVKLEDGTRYIYPNTVKPTIPVECCDKLDVKLGYTCDNNKFVKITEDVSCSVTKPCEFSNKEAVYNTKKPQTLTQECNNGKCENIIKDVECTSNAQCNTGQFCNVNFECEGEENINCEVNPDLEECKDDFNIFLPLIIAGIGILLAISIIIWRMKKK